MGLKAAGAARPTRLRYGVLPPTSLSFPFSFHNVSNKERVSRSRCAHCGGSSAARPNGPGAFYYVVASRVFLREDVSPPRGIIRQLGVFLALRALPLCCHALVFQVVPKASAESRPSSAASSLPSAEGPVEILEASSNRETLCCDCSQHGR